MKLDPSVLVLRRKNALEITKFAFNTNTPVEIKFGRSGITSKEFVLFTNDSCSILWSGRDPQKKLFLHEEIMSISILKTDTSKLSLSEKEVTRRALKFKEMLASKNPGVFKEYKKGKKAKKHINYCVDCMHHKRWHKIIDIPSENGNTRKCTGCGAESPI